MQQIKIFKGVESEISRLEASVNDWIRESEVRVVRITGNIAPQTETKSSRSGLAQGGFTPSDVMILVVYEVD